MDYNFKAISLPLGCTIPIIFITAYDDKASRQRAMQAGAVAFLGKPFNDEKLLQTIRSALRGQLGGEKESHIGS